MYKQSMLLILTMTSFCVQAKNLYVDGAIGNDNISYAENNVNSPWATIERAVWGSTSINNRNASEAAQAGDVVTVKTGTYSATQGTGQRYIPIWNPENSGTDGSPITIKAEGPVILRSDTSTRGEPVIGSYRRDYIIWDGFFVDEPNINTKADTGPVVIWSASNVTLQNLTIQGDSSTNWVDNHNGIRIEDSEHVLINNNTIYGIKYAANPFRNYSAIMTYGTNNVTLERNKIYNSDNGIFIKGGAPERPHNTNIIVQFNLFYDINKEGVALGVVDGVEVRQNIFRDSVYGVSTIGYSNDTPANVEIFNNTFHNISESSFFVKPNEVGYSNISFYNNIVTSSLNAIQIDFSDLSYLTFSHNLYYNNLNQAMINYSTYIPTEWTSSLNKDAIGSTFDIDPMFTNEAENDFSLHIDSPALTGSINGEELGANGFDPSAIGSDNSTTPGGGNSNNGGSCQ